MDDVALGYEEEPTSEESALQKLAQMRDRDRRQNRRCYRRALQRGKKPVSLGLLSPEEFELLERAQHVFGCESRKELVVRLLKKWEIDMKATMGRSNGGYHG